MGTKIAVAERRGCARLRLKTALRVRVLKSSAPEARAVSENLSKRGIFFVVSAPLEVGAAVEILLKMPEEITGEPATEWLCSGQVVRVEPLDSAPGKVGVGVQFDCYERSRAR